MSILSFEYVIGPVGQRLLTGEAWTESRQRTVEGEDVAWKLIW